MDRRKLLTFLTGATAGVAATLASIPFIKSLLPASHIKPPDYDRLIKFPKLQPGEMIAVSTFWGPVYVLKRTPDQIQELQKENKDLRDPDSNESKQPSEVSNELRSIKPEIFVAYGICTHLGCSVTNRSPEHEWEGGTRLFKTGGFICPCHGARYDSAGRVYKNMPAPKNLAIPMYEFVDETTIRLTEDRAH